MSDGIEQRYRVEKIYDPENRHERCRFFVLDISHDPLAVSALLAYADACQAEKPDLALDLRIMARHAMEHHG